MGTDLSSKFERLAALETGQLSDVLDEAGLPNCVLSGALQRLGSSMRMVGVAVCARGERLVRTHTPRPPLEVEALDRSISFGCVLMIDTGGFGEGSCLGGLMAYAFKRSGCRGVVMDGLIRDAEDITSHELPVYCRGVTPVNGARRWGLVEVGGSIRLPGAGGVAVTVVPGDYVVGDADGVVVIPAAVAGSIIADAEKLAQVEQRIAEELQAGGERSDVFRRNPRFSHIRTVA